MLLCSCFLDLDRIPCAHTWQPAVFVIRGLNLIGPCSTKILALKGPVPSYLHYHSRYLLGHTVYHLSSCI